ncbi:MAG: GIY-YIG nuclease family protein [Pacificimonas sp.]|jgi:putative endonuclease|nr:GIY-YIG nuclease family protein [Pacificimonas sp.]
MRKGGCVYILPNRKDGTLYIGVTNDIERRVSEHRGGAVKGFDAKYNLIRLVHYETFATIDDAIVREKPLKRWRRSWKINLIEADNPDWRDLAADWTGGEVSD